MGAGANHNPKFVLEHLLGSIINCKSSIGWGKKYNLPKLIPLHEHVDLI